MLSVRTKKLLLLSVALLSLAAAPAYSASLVGGLYVVSEPAGAMVFVDGELKGVSPCGIPDVAIGVVEVRVVKEGYKDQQNEIEVGPDRLSSVDFKLQALQKVGNIVVLVEPPGARILLDRVPFGRTPRRIINIASGTHTLEVTREGYEPLFSTVSVVAGRDQVVRGRLRETEVAARARPTERESEDGQAEEGRGERKIPLPDEMPEAKAFDPVRKLINEREYDKALAMLDEMALREETAKYAQRIARDRRFIADLQRIVQAGYEGLRARKGERYRLQLRDGIVEGTLLDVTEDSLVIDVFNKGEGRSLPLSRVSASRIVRLAAPMIDPAKPSNQARFAVLLAAEGEFEEAYEALEKAARGNHEVAGVKSFVDAEKVWDAAKQREEEEQRELAQARQQTAEAEGARRSGPLRITMDRSRGGDLPQRIREALINNADVVLSEKAVALAAQDIEQSDVIILCDGGGRPAAPYDAGDVQRFVEFVRKGGGLVFFGASYPSAGRERAGRPATLGNPFNPLLTAFGVRLRADRMRVAQDAPEEYPRGYAVCYPTRRHAVTTGVRIVVFDLSSPSLMLQYNYMGLLRASRYVQSPLAGPSPVMLAATQFGEGRVVAFSHMPHIAGGATPPALRNNDNETAIMNAITWAALPRLR